MPTLKQKIDVFQGELEQISIEIANKSIEVATGNSELFEYRDTVLKHTSGKYQAAQSRESYDSESMCGDGYYFSVYMCGGAAFWKPLRVVAQTAFQSAKNTDTTMTNAQYLLNDELTTLHNKKTNLEGQISDLIAADAAAISLQSAKDKAAAETEKLLAQAEILKDPELVKAGLVAETEIKKAEISKLEALEKFALENKKKLQMAAVYGVIGLAAIFLILIALRRMGAA